MYQLYYVTVVMLVMVQRILFFQIRRLRVHQAIKAGRGEVNVIQCEGLVKIFKSRRCGSRRLQGLNLTVEQGEMMAIIGNSGSGKSTC